MTFETFFERATLHPNAYLITGSICGYRVEELINPLTRKVRYLDKLVDELAKGKKMEKMSWGLEERLMNFHSFQSCESFEVVVFV